MRTAFRSFFLRRSRAIIVLGSLAYAYYCLYQITSLLEYISELEVSPALLFSIFNWLLAALGVVAAGVVAFRFIAFTDDVQALRRQAEARFAGGGPERAEARAES